MKSNKRKNEWFDDDAFWKSWYPSLFTEEMFEQAEKLADPLLELLEPPGKAGLDLCCGPGRMAVPLAARGYVVTGVDRSPYYLNKARARARKAGVSVRWRRKDMRDFVQPETFDFAINMWTSFGYFEDRTDDLRVLENIAASLKQGGKILIDNMGKEIFARADRPTQAEDLPDGSTIVKRFWVMEDWTRSKQLWYLIRGDKVERKTFHLNLYSGQEMRELMERAGFEDVRLYGDLFGRPYDRQARRQITVARKSETGVVGRADTFSIQPLFLPPMSSPLDDPSEPSSEDFNQEVYNELRQLVHAKMSKEYGYSTLQGTALVNEAWLKMGGENQPRWQNRAHFFGAAAEAMRRILVYRARKRQSKKHGGDLRRAEPEALDHALENPPDEDRLIRISEALEKLQEVDPEKAELVKLRYFFGMSFKKAADTMGISVSTAKRWWTFARSWLHREMSGQ